ncbi:metal ABC transporter ATP-binding protein [Alkalihalobacterium chitinilyticum]|uniref:Metal ABC transporter ATP-binding protein n=1 Tax=Alkalihalobacterium chitinilyticum TaxID=2980103 RepID=A0ABT5VEP6_9BACI|nr:metal ABC transporter ATP-binding protein [Alkalihalobacterium chitinilyticum]MDE5413928.1 metal ABC transporter ATP-binding protein [Alkalihalobacterium chitinilyticum]
MTDHQAYAIEVNKLFFRYDNKEVLENVNLKIEEGAFLGLVGPNGSGKSTLLKCLLGLLTPQNGEVLLFGQPLNKFKAWDKVGFVSQKANSFNSGFPATVFEVVSMGLYAKIGLFRFMTKKDKQKVHEAIKSVGMTEFTNRNIGELSGGQQQRVFIARALVSDPKLLILDEPTVGVDSSSVHSFYEMLIDLNKNKNITLLLVTHDITKMVEHVTDIACINTTIHFHGNREEFEKNHNLSSFFGHNVQLLSHNHCDGGCEHD